MAEFFSEQLAEEKANDNPTFANTNTITDASLLGKDGDNSTMLSSSMVTDQHDFYYDSDESKMERLEREDEEREWREEEEHRQQHEKEVEAKRQQEQQAQEEQERLAERKKRNCCIYKVVVGIVIVAIVVGLGLTIYFLTTGVWISGRRYEPQTTTRIYLSGKSLTGSIPKEIGQLTKLTYLNLSRNSLTGSIPAEIGSLTQLTELNLRHNSLSGPVPTNALANLVNLRSGLWLHNNKLSGSIPSSLCSLDIPNGIEIDCGEIACDCCEASNDIQCP